MMPDPPCPTLQVLSLIAELEARLDFDEDLPDMDAKRLQNQVRKHILRRSP